MSQSQTITSYYRQPFLFALALHIILFIILIAHFKFLPKPQPVIQNSPNVIKAVTVNQNQLQNQIARLQATQQAQLHVQQQLAQQKIIQKQQTAAQAAQQKQLAAQAAAQQAALVQAQQHKAAAEKAAQLAAAQQTQEKLAAEQQAIAAKSVQAKRAAALKAQQQKIKAEQKRLAQQAIQQALAEQQQQTDQAQQNQRKKQLQTAKLAAQQLLRQQLASTDNSTSSAKTTTLSAAEQGQVDKYSALVIQAVSQQWIIPPSLQKNLQGKMQVKVAPGGMVLAVTITQSSSDVVFDRSARAAVFKASPLPVPTDPTVFNQFRVLNLTFQPEGITNS